MKKYPSWSVPVTSTDINLVVLFRTLGPAHKNP